MDIFIRHLPWFIGIGTTLLSAALAAIFVIRYKLPALSRKVEKLEEQNESHKDFIKKSELYEKDGQPRYQHRALCFELRGHCAQENQAVFEDIKRLITGIDVRMKQMEEKRAEARTEQYGFMVAVKEKLNLKFELPKIK